MRDVFVEGTTDVSLLNWFFEKAGLTGARAYAVCTIHIPNTYPPANGGGGEKGRVIALAMELSSKLQKAHNVICLVDKDLFGVSVNLPTCSLLWVTDHSCMESYAMDRSSLGKFFRLYFEHELSISLAESIYGVLGTLFLYRATKFELNFATGWVEDFSNSLRFAQDRVELRVDDFLARVVNRAAGAFSLETLLERASQIKQRMSTNPLDIMQKNDVIRLISWIGRQIGCSNNRCHRDPVARALVLALELPFLRSFSLFRALEQWAA